MTAATTARLLLTTAGFYDGLLGIAFLAAAPQIFGIAGIPHPTHWGYVHFGAALLLVFALMFFAAAFHPAGNRNLIAYGMLLKIAYTGVVLYHWMHGDVPGIFKVFFFLDVVWLFALGWIFHTLRPVKEKAGGSPTTTAAASPL
jgi:hypothetical protein